MCVRGWVTRLRQLSAGCQLLTETAVVAGLVKTSAATMVTKTIYDCDDENGDYSHGAEGDDVNTILFVCCLVGCCC